MGEKMKGIICYYSGSGNTKLACQYIAGNLKGIDIKLHNMVKDGIPDLKDYDIIGFAAWTDYWAPSILVEDFIKKLPKQNNKPAFVFNTYGFISGKTQTIFAKLVTARGFKVIAGHALHTPENFPPMIMGGRANEQAPNDKELDNFKKFISELNTLIPQIKEGKELKKGKIKGAMLPAFPREKAKKDMGEKFIDESLCTECGICKSSCPYGAIELSPKPVFDMDKCYGCWACFNHCPTMAIYTNKFRGEGHYPKPIPQLVEKLQG